MYLISPERPADAGAIERLLDAAFGAHRQGRPVYRLRDGVPPLPELGFTARSGDELKATIRFWPVRIAAATPALLLGPIAVAPALHGRGYGVALITHALARARALGHARVLLVGAPGYYGRFGFRPAAGHGIRLWGDLEPDRLQALALAPGGLDGVSGTVGRTAGARAA